MKKFLLLTFTALAFAACSDDNNNLPAPPPESKYDLISFEASEHLMDVNTGEDVKLGDLTIKIYDGGEYTYHNVFCAKAYATAEADYDGYLFGTSDNKIWFGSCYGLAYDSWGGIALSQMADKKAASESSFQQFSVWADGGANATATYAVMYDANTPTELYPEYLTDYGYPTIDFAEARSVAYLYIANSTWVYNYFTGKDTDTYKVKITGSLAGVETSTQTVTLVAGTSKVSDWQKVDLTMLGEVDKLVFKVIADVADPMFFCVDEIALLKPEKN